MIVVNTEDLSAKLEALLNGICIIKPLDNDSFYLVGEDEKEYEYHRDEKKLYEINRYDGDEGELIADNIEDFLSRYDETKFRLDNKITADRLKEADVIISTDKPEGYFGMISRLYVDRPQMAHLLERAGIIDDNISGMELEKILDDAMKWDEVTASVYLSDNPYNMGFSILEVTEYGELEDKAYPVRLDATEYDDIFKAFREKTGCKTQREFETLVKTEAKKQLESNRYFELGQSGIVNVFESSAKGEKGNVHLHCKFYLNTKDKVKLLVKSGYLEEHTSYYKDGHTLLSSYEEDPDILRYFKFEANIYPDDNGNPKNGEIVIYQHDFKAEHAYERGDITDCNFRKEEITFPMNEREIKTMLTAINNYHFRNGISIDAGETLRQMGKNNLRFKEGQEELFILLGDDNVGFSNDHMEDIYKITKGKAYYLGIREGRDSSKDSFLMTCPKSYADEMKAFFDKTGMEYLQYSSPLNEAELTNCDMPYISKSAYPRKNHCIETFLPLSGEQIDRLICSRINMRYGSNDGKLIENCSDLDKGDWINVYARMDKRRDISVVAQIDGYSSTQSIEYNVPLTSNEKEYISELMTNRCVKEKYSIDNLLTQLDKDKKHIERN